MPELTNDQQATRELIAHILGQSRGSNFGDVIAFHAKFGVGPEKDVPHFPLPDVMKFRVDFLESELQEIRDAYEKGDLVAFFDGLIDLVYVALGTADLACLPFQDGWAIVQWANMKKKRATSVEESAASTGRGHRLDVIKPEGWLPPEPLLKELLDMAQETAIIEEEEQPRA